MKPLMVWNLDVNCLTEEGISFLGVPARAFCVGIDLCDKHEFIARAKPVIDWLVRHARNRPTQVRYQEYGCPEIDNEWGTEAVVIFYDEEDSEEFAI